MDILDLIISIAGLVAALVVALIGVRGYTNSVKIRRSEWLYKLYHQFYVEPDLKEIRQLIDSKEGKCEIMELIAKDEKSLDPKECDQLNQFTDYCNFFQFMMVLEESGVLDLEDIKNMFGYYLGLLSSDIIETYLKTNKFKLLSEYLKENPKD